MEEKVGGTGAVPIPKRMRWLPLDPEGRPVMYSTLWSSERALRIDYDPLVESDALYTGGSIGEGEPLVGEGGVHPGRQRECAIRNLCRGCRTPLWREWAWLFCRPEGGQQADYMAKMGLEAAAVAAFSPNAALCYQCARYSVQVCPQLLREQKGHREVTVLCRAKAADLRVYPEPHRLDPSVITFCRLVALRAETFSYAEFLEKTGPISPETRSTAANNSFKGSFGRPWLERGRSSSVR